jgi:hypothetical protein
MGKGRTKRDFRTETYDEETKLPTVYGLIVQGSEK